MEPRHRADVGARLKAFRCDLRLLMCIPPQLRLCGPRIVASATSDLALCGTTSQCVFTHRDALLKSPFKPLTSSSSILPSPLPFQRQGHWLSNQRCLRGALASLTPIRSTRQQLPRHGPHRNRKILAQIYPCGLATRPTGLCRRACYNILPQNSRYRRARAGGQIRPYNLMPLVSGNPGRSSWPGLALSRCHPAFLPRWERTNINTWNFISDLGISRDDGR
jgi:hypothetical protein